MLISILYEVFVDKDMKLLKRSVKIKTLQAQEQMLAMKLQGGFEQLEGMLSKNNEGDPDNKDSPNAIGYGIERD
jgi:hypothetical protein